MVCVCRVNVFLAFVRSWRNSQFVSSNRRRENLCFFFFVRDIFRWEKKNPKRNELCSWQTSKDNTFLRGSHHQHHHRHLFTFFFSFLSLSHTFTPGKLSRWMYSDDGEHLYHEQVHEILNWRPFSFSLSLSHLLFIETANAWRSLRQCYCYCWCTHFGCLSIEVCYSFKSM